MTRQLPATVVLIGPHGAGKTTLGLTLSARLGVAFHDEVGRALAEDPTWRPADGCAARPQPRFDAEVFRRELARDAATAEARVVESWHPVNLAYAEGRNPSVLDVLLPEVRAAARGFATLVQPVTASPTTLARRQSEPGDLSFFLHVGDAAQRWARDLGLRVLPPIATDADPPEVLADLVAQRLEELSWNPCT